MEIKRVKSANKLYLIMGILLIILTIALISAVIYSAKEDVKNLFMLAFPLPIVFFLTLGGGMALIKAYKRLGEFNIYILKKEGVIDFDSLNKEYIQIGDEGDKLYFVEPEDYRAYTDYSLTHSFA